MAAARLGASGSGVVLRGVTKHFAGTAGSTLAVDDVSLDLVRGSFVSIIGPSGCGKSTLLRIVAGLTPSSVGTVSIFGGAVAVACASKQIGFVPQSLALLPWRTVLDNVRLGGSLNRRANRPGVDAVEILSSFGLGAHLHHRPEQLSGGMRQRVAIARAFALAPSLLVMDEPFAALDELTREHLRLELLAQWQSTSATVLFVTHSVTEAVLLSDEVVVMTRAPGRIGARVPIPLARPRDGGVLQSEAFRGLEAEVRHALRAGSAGEAP